jgi:predicted nucleotidyltransferase
MNKHALCCLTVPQEMLANWAETKPTIKALYVFGSYARGEARPGSDLDLAVDVDNDDAELISKNAEWRAELARLTELRIDTIYHSTAAPVTRGPGVLVYRRERVDRTSAPL